MNGQAFKISQIKQTSARKSRNIVLRKASVCRGKSSDQNHDRENSYNPTTGDQIFRCSDVQML